MSASESLITCSLEDILTSLEVQLALEETIEKRPLTEALEKLLMFAQDNHLTDLAIFVTQELDGYKGQPPNNRFVQLKYFDDGGQAIDGLSKYSTYPVTTGVRKLELHLKNGLALRLPIQISTFLSQVIGREVYSGHISPIELKKLLASICEVLSQEIKKLKGIG